MSLPTNQTENKIVKILLFYPNSVSMSRADAVTLLHTTLKIESKKENTTIELILHSSGGDLHAAYKLLKILRSCCATLKVIIPHYAKSASTLIALGADEIIMGPSSELGPLDAQIEHPMTGGINLSALDGVSSLGFFADFSTKLAIDAAHAIRNEFQLGKTDAAKMGLEFSNQFALPILEQLDPLVVNMCYRFLNLSETYGREVLSKYMVKNDIAKAKKIIHSLVYDYPEHGYAIDYDEATKLGLKVKWWDQYDDWAGIYNFFMDAFFGKTRDSPVITFIVPDTSPEPEKATPSDSPKGLKEDNN